MTSKKEVRSGAYTFEILDDDVMGDSSEEEKQTPRKTSRYMSDYEFAGLICARALQLHAPGAKPLVTTRYMDPQSIATKELWQRLVSLTVRRTLADGSIEDWHPSDMKFPPSQREFRE